MNGWLWIVLGLLLLGINSYPPYQRWVRKRLENKRVADPEKRTLQRKRVISLLAAVYIFAGLAMSVFS
jgi:hypothetical protein